MESSEFMGSVQNRWSVAPRVLLASLVAALPVLAATVEIRGKVTNGLTEQQYRSVEIIVTDRLDVEQGRTRADDRGRYQLKIGGPRYIILKALLEGYPTVLYQLDTEEYKESTTDREENKVFGELRIQTYYQDITFAERGAASEEATAPLTLDQLLAQEDRRAVEIYRKARGQREAGDDDKAVGTLESLLKKFPDFYIGYVDLGMILAAQQKNDKAIEVFSKAQQLRPEHSWAYVGLGLALSNKADYAKAAENLQKAVAIEPDSVSAQFQLGEALFKLGQADRALECLQKSVELEPRFNPLAYKIISSIYVGRQDAAGAAGALEAYLQHFPDAADREKVEQILRKLKP